MTTKITLSQRRVGKYGTVSYGKPNTRGTVLLTPGFFPGNPPKKITVLASAIVSPKAPRKWNKTVAKKRPALKRTRSRSAQAHA